MPPIRPRLEPRRHASKSLRVCRSGPARDVGQRCWGVSQESPGAPTPEFRHALVDLNGDNQADALVLLLGMDYCGSGGCTVLVLRGSGTRFVAISRMTVTSEPIRVTSELRNGWKSLIVHTHGADAQTVSVPRRF